MLNANKISPELFGITYNVKNKTFCFSLINMLFMFLTHKHVVYKLTILVRIPMHSFVDIFDIMCTMYAIKQTSFKITTEQSLGS